MPAKKTKQPAIIAAPVAATAPVDASILTPAEAKAAAAGPSMSMSDAVKQWDTEEMRARAVMAATAHIQQIERDERLSIGTWINLPLGMESWYYIRCGRKQDPRAIAMLRRLQRSGYVQAPPQVRLIGFEAEGESGLYVCTPPEMREKVQAAKRRLQKSSQRTVKQTFDSMLNKHAGSLSGASFETYEVGKN